MAAVVLSIGMVASANAGSAQGGTISAVTFTSNGTVSFMHSGQRVGVPGCVPPSLTQRWGFDASTAGGKVMLSGLLAAYAANKSVGIYGTGACSLWGDTETMSWFHTID